MKIANRKLFEGLRLVGESIRPVSEKWDDGVVRSTDNLQLVVESVADRSIKDAMAYLYYFDSKGNEIGHEFDLTQEKIEPGEKARFSLMLQPPANIASAELEIKAEYKKRDKLWVNIVAVVCTGIVFYIYQLVSNA